MEIKSRGFTLIELLVVISIIGLLGERGAGESEYRPGESARREPISKYTAGTNCA